MEIAMVIIVLILMFYAAVIMAAVRYNKKPPPSKPSKLVRKKRCWIDVSKEDLLVLSIIPAFFIAPNFAVMYFFVVAFWVVKKSKKQPEIKSYQSKKNINHNDFNLAQDWEGGNRLAHKPHKRRVQMGFDPESELSWFINENAGFFGGSSDLSN